MLLVQGLHDTLLAHREYSLHVRDTTFLLHEVLHNVPCVTSNGNLQQILVYNYSVLNFPPLINLSLTLFIGFSLPPISSASFLFIGNQFALITLSSENGGFVRLNKHFHETEIPPLDRDLHRQAPLPCRGCPILQQKPNQLCKSHRRSFGKRVPVP